MSGVFISYRRDDTAGYAGRLYDALTVEFDKSQIFIDVDSIHPGEDFVQVIDKRIASSSVVLVLIGKGWLNSGGVNSRRLDDAKDFVRLEVASALRQKIPVIPVLVGGARMPSVGDLPEPLAALAHLNAIEIFDTLFQDSVRHLIAALRPFVPSTSLFRGWNRRRLGGLGLLVLILAGSLGIALALANWRRGPVADPIPDGAAHGVAPDPSETLTGPEEAASTPIKVTTAGDIAELPPVVESAKSVMLAGNSLRVTGPSRPRILWRARVTVGDVRNVVGIASDGTVYVYDAESKVIDAIRDGKEIWAHPSPSPLGFDAEGRLWLADFESHYNFNSRGEGGRVTKKSLFPNPATLQIPSYWSTYWSSNSYSCRDGKVIRYARPTKSVELAWSVDLDGNCGQQDPIAGTQTGTVYVSSDAGTLYGISADGHVRWSVKQACKDASYKVYPVLNDDVVVACPHEDLYALRGGKPLWTASLGAPADWSWEGIRYDAAGNLYLGGDGPPEVGYMRTAHLISLDKEGKPRWTVPAGSYNDPEPAGFDDQGRLYVLIAGHLVVLSQ